MLDIADYADRLINGFCFFVLNLIESVVVLVVNPTKGILRLSGRYRLKLVKQTSSLALIFFVAALLQVVLSSFVQLSKFGFDSGVISRAYDQSIGSNFVATVIVGAVVATAARIQVEILERKRLIRTNRRAVVRLGYYVAYMCVLLCLFDTLLLFISLFFHSLDLALLLVWFVLSPIIVFTLASKYGRSTVPKLKTRDIASTLLVLICSQFMASAASNLYLINSANQATLTAMKCSTLGTNELDVTMIVDSTSQHALFIRREDIRVIGVPLKENDSEPVRGMKEDDDSYFERDELDFNIKEPSDRTPYLLVNPNQSTIVRIVAQLIDVPTATRFRCHIDFSVYDKEEGGGVGPGRTHFIKAAYDQHPISFGATVRDTNKNKFQKPQAEEK
jgi:hypothetical protein